MDPGRAFRTLAVGWTALAGGIALLSFLLAICSSVALFPIAVVLWLGTPSLGAFLILLGLSVALGLVTGLLPAVVLSRFVLRTWPIDASGEVRHGCRVWQSRVAWTWGSLVCLLIASVALQRIFGHGAFRPDAQPDEGLVATLLPPVWAAWGMTIAGGLALSSRLHAQPTYYLHKKFILYLRRFSSFADRTVVAEVLRAAPAGIPVVFIASPQGRARNWDPTVWAFAGLRIRHPLASLPVQLRTSDLTWETAVRGLIARATVAVLDVTDSSPSIEEEKRLLDQGTDLERAILLVDRRVLGSGPAADANADLRLARPVIVYQRRWSLLGMAAKLGMFLFVGYSLFLSYGLIWAGNEVTLRNIAVGIPVIGTWLAVGVFLVVRPSIDLDARNSLRRLVRTSLVSR